MALSVINRPSKDIEGYESTWNAINLPIQYRLNSDLFPVNNVDTAFNITGASNDNSFLSVTISGASTNTLEGETIKIEGSDIESYNGIFRIKEKISNTEYTINVSYKGVPISGTFQKYYNNYFAEVRLYAGLPDDHAKNAEKPTENVGTLRVIPDTDNNIIASFSGLIKDNIGFNNQLTEGIDIDHFTGFYVEYREGYDKNVGGEIETFYEDWQVDEIDNCGNEIITNNSFATDLSGWGQILGGSSFAWNSGSAEASLSANLNTKVIAQNVNLIPNVLYQLDYDITRTDNKNSRFEIYSLDEDNNISLLRAITGSVDETGSITFTPSTNIVAIGFRFARNILATTTVGINEVSLIAQTCQYQFWGSNSSLQFQNERGGNMYDNIAKNTEAKFMSAFNTPVVFDGEYRDDSIILPNLPANEPNIEDIAYMWLNGNDLDGANTDPIIEWTDRTGNVTVTGVLGVEPQVLDSGINGNRGAVFNGVDQYFETNSNISQPSIVYVVFSFADLTTQSIWDSKESERSAFFISQSNQTARLLNGAGNLFTDVLSINTGYVIKAVQDGSNSELSVDNVFNMTGEAGSNNMINIEIGRSEPSSPDRFLNGIINEFIVIPADTDPCTTWQIEAYLGAKYGTYDASSYALSTNEYDSSGNLISNYIKNLTFEDEGLYRIQTEKINDNAVKGDYTIISASDCGISETKSVIYNSECSNQGVYLTWLNPTDGWDYWKFTAEKDYNLGIDDKVTIERNIFSNWDDTFINGNTQLDVINTTAYNELDVYSQYLDLDQLEAISKIKYSTKVLLIDGDKQTTVIVDSDSITLYNDGDEQTLYTIRFKIRLPNIQTQSQ